MKPDRVGCVVNPAAGDGDGERLAADLADLFPDAVVDRTVTRGPEDVPRATRDHRDADLLVAVGGDGTLREVADAVPADAPPLFVVPAGRGNSAYRHFYGDADWRAVARDLGSGVEPWPVDVGRVGTGGGEDDEARQFVLGVTAGLFRRALDAADALRALPGPLAYLLGTGRAALAEPPTAVAVEVDGRPVYEGDARLVAVGGGRYRGRAFGLLPESEPADGDLHVLVVEQTGLRGAVAVARLARDGAHPGHDAVHYHRAETAAVRAPTGLPVEVDGTPLATDPRELRFAIDPGGLDLARPASGGRPRQSNRSP